MQKGAIRHNIIGNVANTMHGVSKEPSELPSWYIIPPNGGPAMHPIPTTCPTKHSHFIQQVIYISSCSQRFMAAALFGVDGYCALCHGLYNRLRGCHHFAPLVRELVQQCTTHNRMCSQPNAVLPRHTSPIDSCFDQGASQAHQQTETDECNCNPSPSCNCNQPS